MRRCQKVPKFDFQSQFSMSKIIQIFLIFHQPNSQNSIISFEYVDFQEKIFLIFVPPPHENSTTRFAIGKVIIVQTDSALILKRELHTCFMSICTQVLCFIKEKHAALLCCCSLLATNIVHKKLLILFLDLIINIYEKHFLEKSLICKVRVVRQTTEI